VAEELDQQQNKIDDYVLLNVIATGKASQVWEVMHEQSGQTMAMKLLLPEAMFDNIDKNLLKHEYKVAQTLEHPNCCRSHGIVMRKTECYLLMDLFKTPNLKILIHSDIVAVQSRFAKLVEGVCLGLGHMHEKGWVHKDLKPDNILLNRASEVRLIDFSLAVKKATTFSKMMNSKRGEIRGTRTYLAPETIRKEPSVPATDIYSLGIIFYECLTGKPTFLGDSPNDLLRKHIGLEAPPASMSNPNVTAEMDRFLAKMLKKKAKDRFQSCEELMSEFRSTRVFKEEVIEGRQETAEEEQERTLGVSGDSDAIAEEMRNLMTSRRDSRSDAVVQEMIRRKPELKATYEAIKQEIQASKDKKTADIARKAIQIEQESEDRDSLKKGKKRKKKKRPESTETQQPAAPQQPAMQQPPMQQPPMQQPMAPQQPAAYYPPQQMPPGYPPGQVPMMPPGYAQPGMPQQGMPPGYPQQMPGGYPQQMPPAGYPQQMPPGYQQQPGMAQPGMPQQPAMMPGQPSVPPGQPGMPQPGMPEQPGVPQHQLMPGMPAGQVPQVPVQAPQTPVQTPQQPVAPQPAPAPAQPAPAQPDDIPLMTDLPDIE
jgi:eukaryotic-like serine/threonine-protein kinase